MLTTSQQELKTKVNALKDPETIMAVYGFVMGMQEGKKLTHKRDKANFKRDGKRRGD